MDFDEILWRDLEMKRLHFGDNLGYYPEVRSRSQSRSGSPKF